MRGRGRRQVHDSGVNMTVPGTPDKEKPSSSRESSASNHNESSALLTEKRQLQPMSTPEPSAREPSTQSEKSNKRYVGSSK